MRVNTEIWYRDPWNYSMQLQEAGGTYNFIWDIKVLNRNRFNAQAWAKLVFGVETPWKSIVMYRYSGISKAIMYRHDSVKAVGVFPIWDAKKHSVKKLINLIENPWGENENYYGDFTRGKFRPIKGQEHIIIIAGIGNTSYPYWRDFMEDLSLIQGKYPDVTLLIYGMYSFKFMFGKGFKAVAVDPVYWPKSGGYVALPCGKMANPDHKEMEEEPYWLNLLGYDLKDFHDNTYIRVEYNIKSHEWASRYFDKIFKFNNPDLKFIDFRNKDVQNYIQESRMNFVTRGVPKPGDKVACDECSLWAACKLYRQGAICVVKDSPMKDVSKMFASRNADKIMDAMGRLLELSSDRIAVASKREAENDEVDPELTKMINSTLQNAERLAKLRDPNLGKLGPSVVVNAGKPVPEITPTATPQVASYIVSVLEGKGYAREDITPDMIQGVLSSMTDSDIKEIEE